MNKESKNYYSKVNKLTIKKQQFPLGKSRSYNTSKGLDIKENWK